jgi:hypothetical protein
LEAEEARGPEFGYSEFGLSVQLPHMTRSNNK